MHIFFWSFILYHYTKRKIKSQYYPPFQKKKVKNGSRGCHFNPFLLFYSLLFFSIFFSKLYPREPWIDFFFMQWTLFFSIIFYLSLIQFLTIHILLFYYFFFNVLSNLDDSWQFSPSYTVIRLRNIIFNNPDLWQTQLYSYPFSFHCQHSFSLLISLFPPL